MNKNLFLLPISVALFLTYNQASAQNSKKLIEGYYQKSGDLVQKSNRNDNVGIIILNEDASKSLHANIVNVQQTYNGLRVFNALGKVIIKEDKVIAEKNNFSRNVIVANQKKTQERFSEESLKQKLGLEKISKINYLPDVYFEKNKVYVLSKELFVSEQNTSDVWHVIADASTGEILHKSNKTLNCYFDNHSHNYVEPNENMGPSFPINKYNEGKNNLANLLIPTDASYNIFPLPVEAPTFGGRAIVINPWDLTASPEGWHSDGTNSYTITRGNNVYAYSDQDNANAPGYSPDGGAALNFNFPFADGRYDNPFTYRDAAVTNLFYMNNRMHDIFYKFGFTEPARNFQINNFGIGGIGGDAVLAEALDASGLNNANFNPGYEMTIAGQNYFIAPRMQMYLWDRLQTVDDPVERYQYNSPVTIINRPKVMTGGATFGSQLFNGQTVTGDLALSVPIDACTPVAAGSLTGKIAVISDEGWCFNSEKIKNVQDAGAIGVIQYNFENDGVYPIDDWAPSVTIPSIVIGKTEGEYLVNQITGGVIINTTLKYDFNGFKHSSLDNGIIVHEYGHGISNRLTGDGYNCLMNIEQMGEGWSDYFTLMLSTRPGDTSSLARSLGTYINNQPITGKGIRPFKYSPDFAINNITYAKTNYWIGSSHMLGFIWATMLWDLTWKYIEKYGYNSDVLANTTSGNARVLQIVVDGMKLQTCNPTFVDGRNAILQADAIGNAGADKCMIWSAFAKRGLGVNASGGDPTVMADQVEDFTIPAECNAALATTEVKTTNDKFIVFPNPTYDEFFVGNIDKSSKEVRIKMFDMSGKLVFSDARESESKKAISTKQLQKGVYMVHIQQGDKTQTEKLIVR